MHIDRPWLMLSLGLASVLIATSLLLLLQAQRLDAGFHSAAVLALRGTAVLQPILDEANGRRQVHEEIFIVHVVNVYGHLGNVPEVVCIDGRIPDDRQDVGDVLLPHYLHGFLMIAACVDFDTK